VGSVVKMQESELYDSVKEYIEKRHKCFFVAKEAGKQGVGSVDVFGVRHTNPEKSEIETIGVEIKVDKGSQCADFGQAKGYSVFCHKMYFASMDKFNQEDKEIAEYLGIGLIQIEHANPSLVCNEVLEAPAKMPIRRLQDYVLGSKRVYQCDSCKIFRHVENFTVVRSWDTMTGWTRQQIQNGKGLRIRHTDGKREFYCNACARGKLNIMEA
jgi:hypothetical protein